MGMNKFVDYYKNNPKGYWFKRKIYGWGWMPVKWQGWLVILASILVLFLGIYVAEMDDSPGLAVLTVLLVFIILIFFGYWKGEKPRWQWGLKNKK